MATPPENISQHRDHLTVGEMVGDAQERIDPQQLAEALQKSRERLALVQKAGSSGTFEWDILQQQGTWTPELEALYGLPAGSFEGKREAWIQRIHPDDMPQVADNFWKATQGEAPPTIEFRIILPDGRLRWMLSKWDTFYDQQQQPIRLLGVNIDITERKVLEKNLQFLAYASKLLSSSLDYTAIWQHLTELAIPYVADWCAVDILDREAGVFDLVAIAHKDPEKVKWIREFRQTNPININDTFGLPEIVRTKQKEYIPLITDELLVAIARSEHDLEVVRLLGMTSALSVPLIVQEQAVGAITFVTSESHRRLTDADVTMAEELASRASLALENAALYRQAQQAITLRDDFIAVASHELKTPITSLKMYTQVLQKQAARTGDGSAGRSLEKMDTQLNKLTRLVNDLLEVSRIQQGRLEFQEEAVDLNEVVQEAMEQVRPSSEKHTIRLEGQIDQPVWGDKERIGQVVTNLLMNAIKFSPNAEMIMVRLATEPESAVVSVQDFGIGIASEHHDKIFDRFYRVTDPEERTYPGLGIGLYISNQIIKRHGGTMWVVSEKGKGASFSFSVPYQPDTSNTR